jgi:hypothetical protein
MMMPQFELQIMYPKTVKGFDSTINTEVLGVCMTKEDAAVVGN